MQLNKKASLPGSTAQLQRGISAHARKEISAEFPLSGPATCSRYMSLSLLFTLVMWNIIAVKPGLVNRSRLDQAVINPLKGWIACRALRANRHSFIKNSLDRSNDLHIRLPRVDHYMLGTYRD